MATAKKRAFNNYSMSRESRNKAYGAINILWKMMRPDLDMEDKDTVRNERLKWIAQFFSLKKLASTTKLSDRQIGLILEEMKRMTGQQSEPKKADIVQSRKDNVIRVDFTKKPAADVSNNETGEIIFTSSEPQEITLEKLAGYIWGVDIERRNNWLKSKKFGTNFKMLEFDRATALTIILLSIAAQKDLKSIHGDGKPISRIQIKKYIPTLKKKLGIDQK